MAIDWGLMGSPPFSEIPEKFRHTQVVLSLLPAFLKACWTRFCRPSSTSSRVALRLCGGYPTFCSFRQSPWNVTGFSSSNVWWFRPREWNRSMSLQLELACIIYLFLGCIVNFSILCHTLVVLSSNSGHSQAWVKGSLGTMCLQNVREFPQRLI